jgi:hypothetical protein
MPSTVANGSAVKPLAPVPAEPPRCQHWDERDGEMVSSDGFLWRVTRCIRCGDLRSGHMVMKDDRPVRVGRRRS